MYDYVQNQGDVLDEQKSKPTLSMQPKIISTMDSPYFKERNSSLEKKDVHICFKPRIKTNVAIQKCDSSDEEEEKEEEEITYESIVKLYCEKVSNDTDDTDDTDGFECKIKSMNKKCYSSINYVIENNPVLLEDGKMYKTLGKIEGCNISCAELYCYGCDLFEYNNSIIEKLVKREDSYEEYTSFFKEKWFEKVEGIFFDVEIENLNKLDKEVLKPLLESKEAKSFISHQDVLSKWLECIMVNYTIKIGFENCIFLKDLFVPNTYPSIPKYAERIALNDIRPFFSKCKELALGENAIDEIAKSNRYMTLVNNQPKILKIIDKKNHFCDWIHILEYLYKVGTVTLKVSGEEILSSKLDKIETYEKTITVMEKEKTINIISEFVYHWHPNGMKTEVGHANVTNRHLKPCRGDSTTVKMDYEKIPEIIKTALGI